MTLHTHICACELLLPIQCSRVIRTHSRPGSLFPLGSGVFAATAISFASISAARLFGCASEFTLFMCVTDPRSSRAHTSVTRTRAHVHLNGEFVECVFCSSKVLLLSFMLVLLSRSFVPCCLFGPIIPILCRGVCICSLYCAWAYTDIRAYRGDQKHLKPHRFAFVCFNECVCVYGCVLPYGITRKFVVIAYSYRLVPSYLPLLYLINCVAFEAIGIG